MFSAKTRETSGNVTISKMGNTIFIRGVEVLNFFVDGSSMVFHTKEGKQFSVLKISGYSLEEAYALLNEDNAPTEMVEIMSANSRLIY